MRTLEEIRHRLRLARTVDVTREAESIARELAVHKQDAVFAGDESQAKEVWCLEQVLAIHRHFREAYTSLRKRCFAEGWQALALVDDALDWLCRHWPCKSNEYALAFIRQQTGRLQSLFPYGWFPSPEILVEAKWCSICTQRITIRKSCGHWEGEVYGGQLCEHIVQPREILGVAMVERPRQKLIPPIVLADPRFEDGGDLLRHGLVDWLITRLPDAFTPWDCEHTTKAHPHTNFRNVGPNGPCPCGANRKYKKCCLSKPEGVPMPHTKFTIDAPVGEEPGKVQYLYDKFEPLSLSMWKENRHGRPRASELQASPGYARSGQK